MEFEINKAIEILERTPKILATFLKDLSSEWIHKNEGADSWSPYDVLGHLIHGEKTDWIERSFRILGKRESNKFEPFDRFAQFEDSKGNIWIGTDGGGLNKFDPETGKFSYFEHNQNNPNSISNNSVRVIFEDKQEVLWIGTREGLNKLNP